MCSVACRRAERGCLSWAPAQSSVLPASTPPQSGGAGRGPGSTCGFGGAQGQPPDGADLDLSHIELSSCAHAGSQWAQMVPPTSEVMQGAGCGHPTGPVHRKRGQGLGLADEVGVPARHPRKVIEAGGASRSVGSGRRTGPGPLDLRFGDIAAGPGPLKGGGAEPGGVHPPAGFAE